MKGKYASLKNGNLTHTYSSRLPPLSFQMLAAVPSLPEAGDCKSLFWRNCSVNEKKQNSTEISSPTSTKPNYPLMILLSISSTHMLRAFNKVYSPTLKYMRHPGLLNILGE